MKNEEFITTPLSSEYLGFNFISSVSNLMAQSILDISPTSAFNPLNLPKGKNNFKKKNISKLAKKAKKRNRK